MVFEALASALILLSIAYILVESGAVHGSRVSELAFLMQAEDIAKIISVRGGFDRIEARELEELAREGGACMKIISEEKVLFESECEKRGGAKVRVDYFEFANGKYEMRAVVLEKNK